MNPTAIVDALGYPAAGLGILIESSGIPFPGEILLLAAAAWAAARHLSIVLVILFGFLGATAGADIGYFLGFKGGRPFVERFGSIFRIRPEHIARSELFFARHGDKAILAARFVIGLRTWGSMLAGMAHMPFWRFQAFSARQGGDGGGKLAQTVEGEFLHGYYLDEVGRRKTAANPGRTGGWQNMVRP